MSGAVPALCQALEAGSLPGAGQRWLVLNANPLPAEAGQRASFVCEQAERGAFLALKAAGFEAAPRIAEGAFDGAIVLLGKQKAANRSDLLRALEQTPQGAPILVAGDKTLGAASLRDWVARHAPVVNSVSKSHAIAFRFDRPADITAFGECTRSEAQQVDEFDTATGAFSPGAVDAGSALLAHHFDRSIAGRVADFGAGWGYLAIEAARRGKPASLDLIESHHGALDAARVNIARLAPHIPARFHWLDLTREAAPAPFDCIVMNPPFHAGRAAEPSLGVAFINAAARALKPGGRLLMVANRKLAYEETLRRGFARVATLSQESGFKVIEATR